MSYTIIPGPYDAERKMTNEVNRAARRCRIGKIKWKQDLRGLPGGSPLIPADWKPPFIGSPSLHPRIGEGWC